MAAKPFKVLDCAQRSEAWYAARLGIFTASRAGEAFAKTVKGEWKADRKDYRTELVLERVTGKPLEDRFNGRTPRIVRDGQEREPIAIRHYENLNGVVVRSCGFVLDNEIPVGCSPDGVIGDFEGILQVKCPKAATHLATIVQHRDVLRRYAEVQGDDEASVAKRIELAFNRVHLSPIPSEYLLQIRHELYVTGAVWEDYISYHPDFPPALQMVVIRATAQECFLPEYATEVRTFIQEVEAECDKIAGWAA